MHQSGYWGRTALEGLVIGKWGPGTQVPGPFGLCPSLPSGPGAANEHDGDFDCRRTKDMSDKQAANAYWRANVRIIWICMAVWALVSLRVRHPCCAR